MSARGRLEAAQARLRRVRDAVSSDEVAQVRAEQQVLDQAGSNAAVELVIISERWRRWSAIRDGRPLHPLSWLLGPVLALVAFAQLGAVTHRGVGWALSLILSIEAWCWVRTNLRAERLTRAFWPREGEFEPEPARVEALPDRSSPVRDSSAEQPEASR